MEIKNITRGETYGETYGEARGETYGEARGETRGETQAGGLRSYPWPVCAIQDDITNFKSEEPC